MCCGARTSWKTGGVDEVSSTRTDQLPGAGRFAPSPTSALHLGNLRTALLAWLYARTAGLNFWLRIEDLDQARSQAAPGVADQQLRDLESLGLDWDGTPLRQSQRTELYQAYACRLESYECFCSRREIAEASLAPNDGFRAYPGTCAQLTDAQRAAKRAVRAPALRVRAAASTWCVEDYFAGRYCAPVDDFVLLRADGTPSYNLAVVVDDGLQGVSQVTRGADLLSSAPRQAWLAAQLGFPQAEYVHVGMVTDGSGHRLAKREHPESMTSLHAAGLSTREIFWILTDSCGLPRAASAHELLDLLRADPSPLGSKTLAAPRMLGDGHELKVL